MKQPLILFVFLVLLCSCEKNKQANTRNKVESEKVIEKQKGSAVKNPVFPVKDLFGIWTTDLEGPHADFELTEKSFYVVDYDGDGDMPYEINKNNIKIYYPDERVKTGLISKAENDTLIIYWASGEYATYVRWTK